MVGTVAVKDPGLLARMLEAVGPDRLAVALDARGLEVVVSGWQEAVSASALDLLRAWAEMGVRTLLYTDVRRDGTLLGLDREVVARVRAAWPYELIVGEGSPPRRTSTCSRPWAWTALWWARPSTRAGSG